MGHNILYIEDNPDNMMLVKRALESRGYVLLEAFKGIAGVEMAESNDVDLILLDINLPDIDGYEVARRCAPARNQPCPTSPSSPSPPTPSKATPKKRSPPVAMCTCPNPSISANCGQGSKPSSPRRRERK